MHRKRAAIPCRCALVLGALLASCPFAFALDPALTIGQYAHTAWRSRDGFTEGVIQAIAQTDDGYLWLGTTLGLLRFDGVRVTPWHAVSGQLPSTHISRLLSARDGTLWIGTARGLASLKDGALTQYPTAGGSRILRLVEDPDESGALLISTRAGIRRLEDGQIGPPFSLPDRVAQAETNDVLRDRDGGLWIGTAGGGLAHLSNGRADTFGQSDDPQHLSGGRARHWGLAGMRERAVEIGAQLDLWSDAGAGTELELRIPAAVAYSTARSRGGVFRVRHSSNVT